MLRKIYLLLSLCLIPLATGCGPDIENYQYTPRPALAVIPSTQPQQSPPLTAQAAIIALRRADKGQGIPDSVEVRLQLQNDGAQSVVFDPKTMQLTGGDLTALPPPITQTPQPVTLGLHQSVTVDAFFPLPLGHDWSNTDLNSFQLRWEVLVDDNDIGQVVYFHRIVTVYYQPYWGYPYYGFYGGVVFVHRRR